MVRFEIRKEKFLTLVSSEIILVNHFSEVTSEIILVKTFSLLRVLTG